MIRFHIVIDWFSSHFSNLFLATMFRCSYPILNCYQSPLCCCHFSRSCVYSNYPICSSFVYYNPIDIYKCSVIPTDPFPVYFFHRVSKGKWRIFLCRLTFVLFRRSRTRTFASRTSSCRLRRELRRPGSTVSTFHFTLLIQHQYEICNRKLQCIITTNSREQWLGN